MGMVNKTGASDWLREFWRSILIGPFKNWGGVVRHNDVTRERINQFVFQSFFNDDINHVQLQNIIYNVKL